ncbi:MAG: hypothetical protein R8P61_34410 [Bacteroidia bacterium]|nr:hypothetical protein [Bacteroidia bacterium]
MKTTTLILVISLICLADLSAQIPIFDLSKYARPTLNRQSLDLSFHLGGTQYTTFSSPNNGSSFGGDFNLAYQSFHNSAAAQKYHNIYLGMRPYRYLAASDIGESKRNEFNGNLGFSSSHLKYSDKQTFIGYRLNLQYVNNSQNQFVRDFRMNELRTLDNRRADNRLSINMPLVIGKGRIEWVDDARHGLFILQALEKNQYLARELSEEDILAFAAHISELKNRRYFDFRLQKIWELEQIHAFLTERGIIEEESIGYFTIVQDIWSFGNQPRRRAGSRFSLGVNPHIRYRLNKNQNTNISISPGTDSSQTEEIRENYSFQPALYMDFFHEKPLSESWQEVFQIKTEIGIGRESSDYLNLQNGLEITENISAWDDKPFIKASAYYTLSFYPNTRTYFEGRFGSEFYQSRFIRSFNTQPSPFEDFSSLETNLGLNAYYYISPQTRLRITYRSQLYSFAERSPFDGSPGFLDALFTRSNLGHQLYITLSHAWF